MKRLWDSLAEPLRDRFNQPIVGVEIGRHFCPRSKLTSKYLLYSTKQYAYLDCANFDTISVAAKREQYAAHAAIRNDPDHADRRSASLSVIYRLVFKLFLQHIHAERAHDFALGLLRVVTAPRWIRERMRRFTAPNDESLRVHALGRVFPSPVGVAAGMDKDARSFRALWALGFGFVEVGTITAIAQSGAADKRVQRLVADRAIVNRMGFPNPGAAVAADRLQRRNGSMLVGVNVGKSNHVELSEANHDYRASVRELAAVSDYLVINVSSPNTPGLRDMQAVELLRPLLTDVRLELADSRFDVPILIKISPDLSDDEVDALARLAVELELAGIVAVNTTVQRTGLIASPHDKAAALPGGGISGAPLKQRSVEVLRRLYACVGDKLTLVSVGGIETSDDIWERILAGATLVQAHTGFIYGGPAWPRKVNRELSRRVRESAASSLQHLVGARDPSLTASLCSESKNSEDHSVVSAVVSRERHRRSGVA